jgi:SPP1 family predicted phage head-tail adaptor
MASCDPPACIGELRNEVTFAEKVAVADEMGGRGPEDARNVVLTTRAKIRGLSGRETAWAHSVRATVTHEVVIRYDALLAPTCGAKLIMQWDGREFNIRSIIDWQERKRWLTLQVDEGVAQ